MVNLSATIAHRAIAAARARVRQSVEGNMTSRVRVTRGDAAVLSGTGELIYDAAAPTLYEGIAHLSTAAGPVTYTIGDEVQFFSSGNATIPLDWCPDPATQEVVPVLVQVNDLLEVTAHDDYVYVGRLFRVVDVEAPGTLVASRRLQIVGAQRNPTWIDSAVRHPSVGQIPDEIPPEWNV